MYLNLLGLLWMLEVLTCFGESMGNRSIEANRSTGGEIYNITCNNNWTPSKCETDGQDSCAIPGWFFMVMAAFQGILLLILGGCLLVGWKYVTSQSKRQYQPDFVPTRGESNNYTPDDGLYLQPSLTNQDQEKVPPCVALSITTTDQETYDRVPVRGGSVNKRGKAKVNDNPEENVTRDSGDHYDFPSKVVRHV